MLNEEKNTKFEFTPGEQEESFEILKHIKEVIKDYLQPDDVTKLQLHIHEGLERGQFQRDVFNLNPILHALQTAQIAVDEINAKMKASTTESFGYNTDEIVSSDIVGMRYGSLFDATQTMVLPLDNGTTEVQVVSWYDNENSYTSQMVRTIKYFSELA